MFTGIVAATGEINIAELWGNDARVVIGSDLNFDDVKLGDSVSVNGVCLTVVDKRPRQIAVDVSAETLRVITGFKAGDEVNLEKALRLSDRLGGHLVSGHVDGVGVITKFRATGDSYTLVIDIPQPLLRYIAPKGSITVHGVSLTVNRIEGSEVFINVIPHTWTVTTFKHFKAGTKVNIEVDMLARYVDTLINRKE